MGGAQAVGAATKTHRLLKLRQLYSSSREDDQSGWLPSWSDDANPWSDVSRSQAVGLGSTVGGRSRSMMGRQQSLAMSTLSGAAPAQVWNRQSRKALQHLKTDERVTWMGLEGFYAKYNTALFMRNLAQHAHKVFFATIDPAVPQRYAAVALPHFLLAVRKVESGDGAGDDQGWKQGLDTHFDTLRDVQDAPVSFREALGMNDDGESDDEPAGTDDDAASSASRQSSGNGAGASSQHRSALVLRVTVSQPVTHPPLTGGALGGVRGGTASRRESVGGASSASSGAAGGGASAGYDGPEAEDLPVQVAQPTELQLQAFRVSQLGRQEPVKTLSADGAETYQLPVHSRVQCTLVESTAEKQVYELEANTGAYNLCVVPPTFLPKNAAGQLHYAVAVTMHRNGESYAFGCSPV